MVTGLWNNASVRPSNLDINKAQLAIKKYLEQEHKSGFASLGSIDKATIRYIGYTSLQENSTDKKINQWTLLFLYKEGYTKKSFSVCCPEGHIGMSDTLDDSISNIQKIADMPDVKISEILPMPAQLTKASSITNMIAKLFNNG